jgi:hypothetical protein
MTYPPQPPPATPVRKGIPNWLKIIAVLAAVVVALCTVGGIVAAVQGVNAAGIDADTRHPLVVQSSAGGVGAPAADKDPPADTPKGPQKAAVGQALRWDDAIGNSGTVMISAVKVAGSNVLVTVDYVCATGSCDYNTFDWTYLDRSGTPHSQGYAEGVKGELNSGTLAAGQKVHGIVVFERGTDDPHGAQIQYAPGFDTAAYFVVA